MKPRFTYQKTLLTLLLSGVLIITFYSFKSADQSGIYKAYYFTQINALEASHDSLQLLIQSSDINNKETRNQILEKIQSARYRLKAVDFWLRYLDPLSHKRLNGPLPVEWETEVFEKFEKPYKRLGAGYTLAFQLLQENEQDKQQLQNLLQHADTAFLVYRMDSITSTLNSFDHFYLCNRLFLLNLAALYTTGFECPDSKQVIPELASMIEATQNIYNVFNQGFPEHQLTSEYLSLYKGMMIYVRSGSSDPESFDHFHFIRDYVNPLYTINSKRMSELGVKSRSFVDFSLNNKAESIFAKDLYTGQNTKGVFYKIKDQAMLNKLEELGRLLFFDPILSANNERSCASCHKPGEGYTETTFATSLAFNKTDRLARNTPSLLNAPYNHLVMLDGFHFTLQNQIHSVITNGMEMGDNEHEIVRKVMSCKTYKQGFKALLPYTPYLPEITLDHIASAITYYYGKLSEAISPFDLAMNKNASVSDDVINGFNLFMGKAQCATCHFVPQFNGVKPPYVGSEFEVLGVPADTAYSALSKDPGRYNVNPADETKSAFRTGTIRNAAQTSPYMHNGVFKTLEEVIDFYNNGGGAGHGLSVPNQTLSSDSLQLTTGEKQQLILFIKSLSESYPTENFPVQLPISSNRKLNFRKPGGTY